MVCGMWQLSRRAANPCRRLLFARHATYAAAGGDPATIYALSSGPGKAGISIVRVSGPRAADSLLLLTGKRLKGTANVDGDSHVHNTQTPTAMPHPAIPSLQLPPPRKAVTRRIVDAETGETIDRGIVLWFPAPASATGEDVCEFHVHGGTAVVRGVLSALSKVPGLRMADPGDFAKRAFFNGKIDLTSAEGLADLINAETEAQRKQALRQMSGDLGRLYNGWANRLLTALAHVEAVIDFSEDADIDDGVLETELGVVREIDASIRKHLSDGRRGERLRNGVHASIGGPPNVGKSSLLNALCQRPAAIVSPIAGTTRDVVDVALNVRGFPLLLSDTAGLRSSPSDVVETEGIRRARERIRDSDVRIWVVDASANASSDDAEYCIDQVEDAAATTQDKCDQVMEFVVCNKIDLFGESGQALSALSSKDCVPQHLRHFPLFPVSCVTGDGIDAFVDALGNALRTKCEAGDGATEPGLTQARHREALMHCQSALAMALEHSADVVVAAEAMRAAIRHLGRITGRVNVEAILDVIFRDFCIGK